MCAQSRNNDEEETYIIPADGVLRKKIGKHVVLSQVFTPEKMQECQQMVNDTLAGFLAEMETQLSVIGSEYMKAVEHPQTASIDAGKVDDLAFTIKRRMETLNYIFGFNVAKSLYDYIQTTTINNSDALVVVCKHIAVLNLIIKDNIKDDGGALGKEMLANLNTLSQKSQKE